LNKILIPYISQDNINHKYYLRANLVGGGFVSNIFASGLYPRKNDENKYIYSIISEPILLYDEVIITKDDFCYLLTVVDHDLLDEFLDSGVLKIVDTDSFRFLRSKDPNTNLEYFLTDKGQGDKAGFRNELNKVSGSLSYKIDKATMPFENKTEFINSVINESNNDLINGKLIQFLNLDSIIISGQDIPLNNYKTNRIFYMNYFYALQAKLCAQYSFQDEYLYKMICTKISSHVAKLNRTVEENFFTILNFNNILDLKSLVAQGRLSMKQLLKIRESRNCKEFRDWIFNLHRSNCDNGNDSIDIIRAYHEACIEKGKIESCTSRLPYKILNTVVPTLVGLIPGAGFVIGAVYSAFDNFKDMFLHDWKPHFFIDELKRY